jgi:hypothetical protein
MEEGTKKTDGIPKGIKKKLNRGWVDARSLQRDLGSLMGFSNWIRNRIVKFKLEEGADYEFYSRPNGFGDGLIAKEYILSPGAVKKIINYNSSLTRIENDQISTFTIKGRELNVIYHKGELWFFQNEIMKYLRLTGRATSKAPKEGRMSIIVKRPLRIIPSMSPVLNEWGVLWFIFHTRYNETVIEVSKWFVKDALPAIRRAYSGNPPPKTVWLRRFLKSFRKEATHEQA